MTLLARALKELSWGHFTWGQIFKNSEWGQDSSQELKPSKKTD